MCTRSLSITLTVLLLTAAAHAQPVIPEPEQKARALTRTGLEHYREARYDEAITAFKAAYELVPATGLLFNIAQAYRLKGDRFCADAARYYRELLRLDPAGPNRATATEHLRALEGCAGRAPSSDQPATATAAPTYAPAGPLVTADTPRPDPRRGRVLKLSGIAAGVVGAGLGAWGIYNGVAAAKRADDLSAACRTGCLWNQTLIDLENQRRSHVTQAAILGGVGGAALVTGAVLYYLGWRQAGAEKPRPSLAVTGAPGVVGLTLTTRF